MSNYEKLLMRSLSAFYGNPEYSFRLVEILENKVLSLRLIEYFCSLYSKNHNTVIDKDGCLVNVHDSYKIQLKAYSKAFFDIFQRKEKIQFFYTETKYIITTPGQLSFFRWFITHNLDIYLRVHREVITDSLNTQKTRLPSRKSPSNSRKSPSTSRTKRSPSTSRK